MAPESEAVRRQRFENEALPHLDALFRTAQRLTRNRSDAEDLVQETLLKAWRGFDGYRAGTNCKAWLFRILVNTNINLWTRKARRPQEIDLERVEPIVAAAEPQVLEVPTQGELEAFAELLDDEVRTALHEVPAPFRVVLVLSVIEGFQYKEIAEILGIPIGTVMSRLHRARRQLQVALHGYARRRGLVRE